MSEDQLMISQTKTLREEHKGITWIETNTTEQPSESATLYTGYSASPLCRTLLDDLLLRLWRKLSLQQSWDRLLGDMLQQGHFHL